VRNVRQGNVPVFAARDDPPNLARFCFLNDPAIDFYPG
jgi:hypothetical protein